MSDPAQPKTIAVFDLDRTITRYATFTPWLLYFVRRRPWRLAALPVVLAAAVGYKLKLVTRKGLKEIMLKAVMAGTPAAEVTAVTEAFVKNWIPRFCRPGAMAAIAAHRAAGDMLVMATASNDVHAIPLARALGFDMVVATRAELAADGALTGRILGENCYGQAKLDMIKAALDVGNARTVAYSDHHSDLPFLAWATKGVAVNPTPKLRKLAKQSGMDVRDWNHDEPS